MSPPIKLSHFYLQVLALGLIITGAWARDPGPSHPTPSPKWLPKRDSIPLANATGAIAAFDRYCPWCWGNLKIPDDPSNMTCHCNIVVQRPVDASRPLSEYIDVAVLSHDFKELRGMQLRVPWDVPTNIAVVLVEPYKNGTVQVTVVSPTGPGGGNGTGTGTETDGMNGAPILKYFGPRGLNEGHYTPAEQSWQSPVGYVDPNSRYVIYHTLFDCMPSS